MKKTLTGFWQVVGHKPYAVRSDITVTTSTFALEASAKKFAKVHGGEVKPKKS